MIFNRLASTVVLAAATVGVGYPSFNALDDNEIRSGQRREALAKITDTSTVKELRAAEQIYSTPRFVYNMLMGSVGGAATFMLGIYALAVATGQQKPLPILPENKPAQRSRRKSATPLTK